MLSFFPRDVFDEILDLIETVSEGFPTYSYIKFKHTLLRNNTDKWVGPQVLTTLITVLPMKKTI